MASEIEAKLRLTDIEAMRRRLRDEKAERLGAVAETNQFFDWPDHALREADCGLRVRRSRPLDADAPVEVTVTYKGPRRPGELKIREEIEFGADDADMAETLLAALGLQPTVSFEKRRESWVLGDCRVELDELPMLGSFIEIEGPDEAAVQEVRARLGLGSAPVEPESYLAMVQRYRRSRGLEKPHLGFS